MKSYIYTMLVLQTLGAMVMTIRIGVGKTERTDAFPLVLNCAMIGWGLYVVTR